MDAYVKSEIQDGIAEIEFFHPAHNSLPGDLLKLLAESITSAGHNDQVQLILVKSGGERTFCAGASFDELVAIEDEVVGKKFFMGFATVINAIRKCPKLVIGRVQGKTVGGGVGLACAFDYCIATKFASIRLSELAVGIGPFVIGPVVERKCGLSEYAKMSLTPNVWQTASYAAQNGIYSNVFDSATEMDDFLKTFTTELLNMNPVAIQGLKKVFWEGTEHWDDLLEERAQLSGELVLSAYAKNAIQGFLAQ